MVTPFKNTSYRWLRERELPVGVRAKGRYCACVWSERKREETRGQRREKQRGGWVKEGGAVRNVNGEGWVGGSICVCVCVHVLTVGWSWEKLLWRSPELRRRCCRLPPPDLHTHTNTRTQNQLYITRSNPEQASLSLKHV